MVDDSIKSDKITITNNMILMMEKASRLNVTTSFEDKVLIDRIDAVKKYSMKAVISKAQLGMIKDMSKRYDNTMTIKLK